ncbi:hypothetical protein D3C81_1081720 [compost metagenome]
MHALNLYQLRQFLVNDLPTKQPFRHNSNYMTTAKQHFIRDFTHQSQSGPSVYKTDTLSRECASQLDCLGPVIRLHTWIGTCKYTYGIHLTISLLIPVTHEDYLHTTIVLYSVLIVLKAGEIIHRESFLYQKKAPWRVLSEYQELKRLAIHMVRDSRYDNIFPVNQIGSNH